VSFVVNAFGKSFTTERTEITEEDQREPLLPADC